MLKDSGRQKSNKNKQFVICKDCGKKVYLSEENTEKCANVEIVYCECGSEMQIK